MATKPPERQHQSYLVEVPSTWVPQIVILGDGNTPDKRAIEVWLHGNVRLTQPMRIDAQSHIDIFLEPADETISS